MAQILLGTVLHTVLLYVVSDPGDWTDQDIVDDLDGLTLPQVQHALQQLTKHGLVHINSTDHRLWPTRAGKDQLRQAV